MTSCSTVPLIVFQGDLCAILVVTGNVICRDCLVAEEGALVVGGSLTVAGTLATKLAQMGALCVAGKVKATTWLETSSHGIIKVGQQPEATLLQQVSGWPTLYRTEGSSKIDWSNALPAQILAPGEMPWSLRDAMLGNGPIAKPMSHTQSST